MRYLVLALLGVVVLTVLMVWFPMSRTTAMTFAFLMGVVVGGASVGALTRKRSE